mmetsp:Transcript_4458/g.9893  ORF Transcript_4458/g.9893 Transcript_4458/m.9893 type:complete len:244 (-) Transcript_4458:733-1464(-)
MRLTLEPTIERNEQENKRRRRTVEQPHSKETAVALAPRNSIDGDHIQQGSDRVHRLGDHRHRPIRPNCVRPRHRGPILPNPRRKVQIFRRDMAQLVWRCREQRFRDNDHGRAEVHQRRHRPSGRHEDRGAGLADPRTEHLPSGSDHRQLQSVARRQRLGVHQRRSAESDQPPRESDVLRHDHLRSVLRDDAGLGQRGLRGVRLGCHGLVPKQPERELARGPRERRCADPYLPSLSGRAKKRAA